jgi:hypothetical protein
MRIIRRQTYTFDKRGEGRQKTIRSLGHRLWIWGLEIKKIRKTPRGVDRAINEAAWMLLDKKELKRSLPTSCIEERTYRICQMCRSDTIGLQRTRIRFAAGWTSSFSGATISCIKVGFSEKRQKGPGRWIQGR